MKKAESRLQRKFQQHLREEGAFTFKLHAGPFMPAGLPDIIGCLNGIFIAPEVKTDTGRPSEIQLATMEKIRRAGGITGLVRTEEDLDELIRQARRLSARRPK